MRVLENGSLVCKKAGKKVDDSDFILLDETKKYRELEVVVPDKKGECKKGDIVYVPYQAATKVEVEGQEFFTLNIKNIMFII